MLKWYKIWPGKCAYHIHSVNTCWKKNIYGKNWFKINDMQVLKRKVIFMKQKCLSYITSGLSNLRPTGRMQPARQYCAVREVIHILIVSAELMKKMKPESTVLWSSAQLIHCSCQYDGLIVKILWKSIKLPLFCFIWPALRPWLTARGRRLI